MKTMSQVLHIQDCPETLDEARAMIAQQAARISQLERGELSAAAEGGAGNLGRSQERAGGQAMSTQTQWHNPENVSADLLPKGYRFLTKEEHSANVGCRVARIYDGGHSWVGGNTLRNYYCDEYTYCVPNAAMPAVPTVELVDAKELAELRGDKARLDWLDEEPYVRDTLVRTALPIAFIPNETGAAGFFRAAIDAARKEAAK